VNLRSKEIYVSGKTKQRLFWILQTERNNNAGKIVNTQAETITMTIDSIADRLLNEIIETKYPNMKTLEKRLDALENQLVNELLNPEEEK
jgi:aconitase B